ncbi:uncharacterized protein [Argopecten irradians]|uniref:uncharacterized protein n=1 Tax=Argopecten irradians TaxID=31199 RepID=UPI003712AEBF
MDPYIYWFVCVLNILGVQAAPYLDAYVNPDGERSGPGMEMKAGMEMTPGKEMNPGMEMYPGMKMIPEMDFESGNWTTIKGLDSDLDGDESVPIDFLRKLPEYTTEVTVDKVMDLFIFLPEQEDVCYIKDMADFEKYASKKYTMRTPADCNDTKDDTIPDYINLSLPEKCRQLPIKWLDEFYCENNLDLDNPDVIKALRPFPGLKRFCAYEAKTIHTQKCYRWKRDDKLLVKKTLVCLRSIQVNSKLKCKKEVTNHQSDKVYAIAEEKYDDNIIMLAK